MPFFFNFFFFFFFFTFSFHFLLSISKGRSKKESDVKQFRERSKQGSVSAVKSVHVLHKQCSLMGFTWEATEWWGCPHVPLHSPIFNASRHVLVHDTIPIPSHTACSADSKRHIRKLEHKRNPTKQGTQMRRIWDCSCSTFHKSSTFRAAETKSINQTRISSRLRRRICGYNREPRWISLECFFFHTNSSRKRGTLIQSVHKQTKMMEQRAFLNKAHNFG